MGYGFVQFWIFNLRDTRELSTVGDANQSKAAGVSADQQIIRANIGPRAFRYARMFA